MGERLRRARQNAVLSQADLAARSGVKTITISRIERGVISQPYPRTLRALAGALGVEPKWLRDGNGGTSDRHLDPVAVRPGKA